MTVITATYRFTGQGEDFGPRKGSGLVTLHTTESAVGRYTVADAITLAKWQDRDDTLGSYNRLICTDGVLSCVPDARASGGVNPSSASWAPKSWLYDMLPAAKVNDPNGYGLNLSAMGQRALFDRDGWPPAIIDGFARSIIEEEARIGGPVVVANHADFQTNRTDAGAIAMGLVMARYRALTHPSQPIAEDSLTIVTLTPYTAPRRFDIPNGVTVQAYEASGPVAGKTITGPSGARADAAAIITQDPPRAPRGGFLRVYDGFFAGLYIPANQVTLAPEPPVGTTYTQAEMDAAKKAAAQQAADAVLDAAEAAAGKY